MAESEYFGKLAEAAARARYHLTESRCSWHDAELPNGRPVETKACRMWVSNGNHDVRGRWWIERKAHEKLVENNGMYALALYDPQTAIGSGPIVDIALIPSTWLAYVVNWTTTGGHHKGEEVTKVRWSALLEEPVLEGAT